jgi:hypothetical protein
VGRLHHIAAEINVFKYRTADWADADGVAFDAHFINHFCDKAVNYAVGTSGAVVVRHIY